MIKGLVSIITPAYNCGRYIGETIESVIKQTYTNWEMIIVDDCSSDNTKSVVQAYLNRDQRIQYHTLKINSGAATARTFAMELAQGEYMAFLDSDDLWMPDKLDKQICFMKENNCNFSCTSYQQINENGNPLNRIIRTLQKTDYNRLLLDCPIGNSSVMYNIFAIGKYRVPNIKKRNDDALWLQILKNEKYIYGMKEVLMKYRVRNDSISSHKKELIKYHWQLYREIERLSIIRSSFHVCLWIFIKVLRLK
jgi:Glycosyltransferases involved in cell wall biogenesis